MWKRLYVNKYNVELNGFAIVGLVTASLYGVVALVKEIISLF